MTGITNRPKEVEDQNQERVEERKAELADSDTGSLPRKDHPMGKDRARDVPGGDRASETTTVEGGPEHKG